MVELEPCVLIVDDEQGDLERITKALASIRLRVLTISDPLEVLQKVGAEHPDLVILDALLPGLSGFDLCKQIKTEPDTKSTLVIILTGVYLKDHYRREAIHQFKADAFATKPFRERELQRLVLKLLAKKLQMSPKQLQDSLADSQDILLISEVEEKPSWVGRIFGRLKGTPAESGFLHTATETRSAEEPAHLEDDAPEIIEEIEADVQAEEGEREDVVSEEPKEAEVEAGPEEIPEEVEGKPWVPPESEPRQPEAASVDAVEEEREDPQESATEIEAGDEPEPHEPGDGEEKTGRESDEAFDEIPSWPSLETGSVDLPSAQAVFDDVGAEEDMGREAGDESETEDERETEKTMPAIAAPTVSPAHAEEEASDQSVDTEEAEAPAPARRPRALHEDLAVYQEEDYLHELKRELLMCDRVGRPLTLIMVRIADLDQIVELLGRQFRTKVLLHVAEQALLSLREIDMVGLLESKEFIALTAFASDRYGGDKIVSRLRTLLGHNPFQVGEGLPSFIPDLRFGMAVYPKDVAGIDELVERAEEELEKSRGSD